MIRYFKNDYEFLSNFHVCPRGVEYDGVIYPSVEHAYQASKSVDLLVRLKIATSPTPNRAKGRGRQVELRPNFEEMKDGIMLKCVLSKFDRDRELAEKLMKTGDNTLVEGNHWNDTYWGMVLEDGKWVGRNQLGKTLERVRAMLVQGNRCRMCDILIETCELCNDCAVGNDPFISSKYGSDVKPI
jgi:ribA/ribD-fused uncharacterized protein